MQLKNLLVITALVLLLSSCAWQKTKTEYQYKEVPVPVPCISWQPDKPLLVFDTLPPEAGTVDRVKALMLDLEAWKAYAQGLVLSQKSCKIAPDG